MDSYEATRIVFSRIQNLDPENASKIMGLLLIQDHGEKELIRLAFGPEALVHSVILKARKDMGLPSNSPPTPTTPSLPNPFLSSTNPISICRQNSCSSRLSNFLPPAVSIPNPYSSSSASSAPWGGLSELMSPSNLPVGSSSASMNSSSSSSLPFYGTSEVMDDFQLQDQFSFLNDGPKNPDLFYNNQHDLSSSPTNGAREESVVFPSYWGEGSLHRRSCSVNDVCLGSDDPNAGFCWKPCLYYARGYCKNGTSCRFLHGGLVDSGSMVGSDGSVVVGSPSKLEIMDQTCHELLRSKSAQQQRMAAASQLMAASSSPTSFPFSPKCMSLLLQHQQNETQRAAAALMMGEDLHKFSRSPRNELSINGFGGSNMVNPASRQIYLTFPADSTFREEDVSNYFSIYGPVQDVRIPYQQKRMFGFVTFVYSETVKIILAKGNPHFVCDARVLVKPYKEKGKIQEKKQQQQLERGDFSPCGTPTGMDSRDPFDHQQRGPRVFYNPQDILWRRKLEEQAELEQALELQNRRLMNLQLLQVTKHQRAVSTGSPVQSPLHSPSVCNNQNLMLSSIPRENNSLTTLNSVVTSADQPLKLEANLASDKEPTTISANGKGEETCLDDVGDLFENMEHNLPDSPFASPTKVAVEYVSGFSNTAGEANNSDASANTNLATSLLPGASTLEVGTFKSFNFQASRFSSSHGAIGMYAGSNGSKCPVGI